jgi:ubiquinone biosynthesis protein COQ9
MATAKETAVARRIVDTAVAIAEEGTWESVRLHEVAAHMGIGLDEIRRHFREKDELIDAWFDRADAAVLRLADSGALLALGPRERLFRLIMAWLDALEGHRRVSRQMILAKLEPGHLHIQIPALMVSFR